MIWDEFGGSKFLQRYNIFFDFVHTTLFQQMLVGTTATWQLHQAALVTHPLWKIFYTTRLCDCPHSKELWLLLGLGGHMDFLSLTNVTGWVKQMACGTRSLLFLPGLWQTWCWRNNRLYEKNIRGRFKKWWERLGCCMTNSLLFANLQALIHLWIEF